MTNYPDDMPQPPVAGDGRPRQLIELTTRVPKKFISQIQTGGGQADYVEHSVIRQLLLRILGPYSWRIEGPYRSGDDQEQAGVTGVLTVTVDGREVSVSGVGQGRDVKTAESDAMKRAAMNLGVGLHLWAQDNYFLDTQLAQDHPEKKEVKK